MSYANHLKNLRNCINELNSTRVDETNKIMHDDVALVKSRVINKGELSDGSSTGTYSQAVVPSPFYIPKLISMNFTNPIAKLKDIQKKNGWFFSYETFRKETGRRIDRKNFSLSGNMWKKVKALLVQSTPTATTYIVGSDDQEAQKLIEYNTAQSGPFLDQSEDEKALLTRLNRERVLKVMRKHNLA